MTKTILQKRLTDESSPLLLLPEEVLLNVVECLDQRSNVRALLTCKKLFSLASRRVYIDLECIATSAHEYEPNKVSIDESDAQLNLSRLSSLSRFKASKEGVKSIKISLYFAKSSTTFVNRLPMAHSFTTKSATLLKNFPNLTNLCVVNHDQTYVNTIINFPKLKSLTMGVMSEKFNFAGYFINSPNLSQLKIYYDICHNNKDNDSKVDNFEDFGRLQLETLVKRFLKDHPIKIHVTLVGVIDRREDITSLYTDYATCVDLDRDLPSKVEHLVYANYEIESKQVKVVGE
ncbi:hypothetical protein E3Q19_03310 [Wallemia mellicola]|nr:hypothetical protein E3Q19_03310 [Wallemia mellicola]